MNVWIVLIKYKFIKIKDICKEVFRIQGNRAWSMEQRA
jgi:hypothetical protein